MKELGLCNRGNRADRSKNRDRHFAIHSDERDRIGSALGFAAAKGERGDIYAKFAQCGPDLADDARFVAVPQIENGALELRFQWNSFDLQHTRRAVVQNRPFCGESRRGSSSLGQRGDFECIWEAMLAPPRLFFRSEEHTSELQSHL